jgi:hypothetical protein
VSVDKGVATSHPTEQNTEYIQTGYAPGTNPEILAENPEATIVAQIRERYRVGRQANNQCFDRLQNIDLYTGKKKVQVSGTKTQPKVDINIIKTAVDIITSILNDTPCDILSQARTPDDEIRSIVWQKIIDFVIEQNMMDYKRPQMTKYFLLLGTGTYKVVDGGNGYPEIRVVNSSRIVVDPVATNYDEIRWVTELTIHNKAELQQKYPHYLLNASQGVETGQFPELSRMNSAEFQFARGLEVVYEHWDCITKRRYLSTDWQVLEGMGDEGIHGYPYDHPYVFGPCSIIPNQLFGDDIVTNSAPIQEELNTIYKRISQNIGLHGNPQKVFNADIVDPETMSNEPGLSIPVRGPVELRQTVAYLEPFQISPALYQFVDKMEWFFNTQMNLSDVVLGRAVINSSLPAGRAIEDLQKSAMTRPRDMINNLRMMYTALGKKIVALAYKIMDKEIEMKITGKDLNTISLAMSKNDTEAIKQMNQVGVKSPKEIEAGLKANHLDAGIVESRSHSDTYYMRINPRQAGDPSVFDIKVKAGSDTPQDKLDMAQEAKELFMAGKLSPKAYFELRGFPNYETLLPEMADWQQFQQWKQMQMQIQKQKQQQAINVQVNPKEAQNGTTGQRAESPAPPAPAHFVPDAMQGNQPGGQ